MDQEKIGKFIAYMRREKKITQNELAEKLGVTDRSVSNWENGKNMPDLSLFKPLCEILNISINELLSGERITKENYQEKLEENIVNTIDYTTKKENKSNLTLSIILVVFGVFISLSAVMIFPSESSWGSVYSVFGTIIFVIGISKLTRNLKYYKRLILILTIFIGTLGVLFFTDYINVKNNNEAPMFRETIAYLATGDVDITYYDTLFYDVINCDINGKDSKFEIVKNKDYTENDLINYCLNK